jgi:hypothetical protein
VLRRSPATWLAIFALAAALTGCAARPSARPVRALSALLAGRPVAWRTLTMPRHARAGDFDVECDGVGYRIDMGRGTYTWLLGDSTDRPNVARFTLSEAQRDTIWSWLLDADYFEMPPHAFHASGIACPPGLTQTLEVRLPGSRHHAEVEEIMGYGSGAPDDASAARLDALCDRIRALVERDPDVQRLPRRIAHPYAL